ncbi:hypothetical protein F5Y18DRAFT_430910 [Xylariaceae sp. FL1019]|nr:hypothetical protein F5Y18DRAFT_430910 [Xylariaceae sp. FL1019]
MFPCVMQTLKSLWLTITRFALAGTPENMSPESTSSLFPDRPIRPLPKRRLRERLSPEVADSIKFPPAPQTNTPLFVYPYNTRDEPFSTPGDPGNAVSRENVARVGGEEVGVRRNTLTSIRDDDSLMGQARRALGSRGFHEPRASPSRSTKAQPPPSTASSVDGYDSFENTNNKKKRKIPIAGESVLNGAHALSDAAGLVIPSHSAGGESEGDASPTATVYHQSGGLVSNGQGISGPGRGRFGRIGSNSRVPLRALSDANGSFPGRNIKVRLGSQHSVTPAETSGIISTAIASAEKLPVPTGQENISLLQQHQQPQSIKTSPTSSTQFTFTFGSHNPVSWPGSDPVPHNMSGSNSGANRATSATSAAARGGQSQHEMPSSAAGPSGIQGGSHIPNEHTDRGTQETSSSKKSRRRSNSLARAANQRRRKQEVKNLSNPPTDDDWYLCVFCEYERIFGAPPRSLIKSYEVKDRRRRHDEAERRRLLEKAKSKSRKGKKANKAPQKSETTATDQNSVSNNDAQVPPPPPPLEGDQYDAENLDSRGYGDEPVHGRLVTVTGNTDHLAARAIEQLRQEENEYL